MIIKRVKPIQDIASISSELDNESVPCHELNCVNWSEYSYKPEVKLRIAHDGLNIYLNWQVCEKEIKATCTKDCGDVYKDSCVEFFITFNNLIYYNIESNCIGRMLIATGNDRYNRQPIEQSILNKIGRRSSLEDKEIENLSGKWELSLIIPVETFLLDNLKSFDGLKAKGNFYKCGDDLIEPHFLSYFPIPTPQPDFHLSEFFGCLDFEQGLRNRLNLL